MPAAAPPMRPAAARPASAVSAAASATASLAHQRILASTFCILILLLLPPTPALLAAADDATPMTCTVAAPSLWSSIMATGTAPLCTVSNCTFDPPKPARGVNLTITLDGVCAANVTEGSTYALAASVRLRPFLPSIPVLSREGDACAPDAFSLPLGFGKAWYSGATCPVEAGAHVSVVTKLFIADIAPAGTYDATLKAYDALNRTLFDVDLNIKMPKSAAAMHII